MKLETLRDRLIDALIRACYSEVSRAGFISCELGESTGKKVFRASSNTDKFRVTVEVKVENL